MTIQSTDRKAGPFLSGTALPFEFKVFSKEDIAVIYTNAEGVEVVLVLDSDYSVTLNADQDNNPGGTATLTTAIVTGDRANIIGDLAYDQGTDIRNQGGFEPEIIENALDRATIQIQQLKEISERTLKTAPGDSRTGDELLADIFEAEENAAASAAAAEESANRVDLGALDDAVAQTQADVVTTTTQAGIATTQAGIATAQAVISAENADLTAADVLAAEAARDSTFFNAGRTFTSTAAGLAGSTDGQQFAVVEGDDIQVYTRTNSTTATIVTGARYPSSNKVTNSVALAVPWLSVIEKGDGTYIIPSFQYEKDLGLVWINGRVDTVANALTDHGDGSYTLNEAPKGLAGGVTVFFDWTQEGFSGTAFGTYVSLVANTISLQSEVGAEVGYSDAGGILGFRSSNRASASIQQVKRVRRGINRGVIMVPANGGTARYAVEDNDIFVGAASTQYNPAVAMSINRRPVPGSPNILTNAATSRAIVYPLAMTDDQINQTFDAIDLDPPPEVQVYPNWLAVIDNGNGDKIVPSFQVDWKRKRCWYNGRERAITDVMTQESDGSWTLNKPPRGLRSTTGVTVLLDAQPKAYYSPAAPISGYAFHVSSATQSPAGLQERIEMTIGSSGATAPGGLLNTSVFGSRLANFFPATGKISIGLRGQGVLRFGVSAKPVGTWLSSLNADLAKETALSSSSYVAQDYFRFGGRYDGTNPLTNVDIEQAIIYSQSLTEEQMNKAMLFNEYRLPPLWFVGDSLNNVQQPAEMLRLHLAKAGATYVPMTSNGAGGRGLSFFEEYIESFVDLYDDLRDYILVLCEGGFDYSSLDLAGTTTVGPYTELDIQNYLRSIFSKFRQTKKCYFEAHSNLRAQEQIDNPAGGAYTKLMNTMANIRASWPDFYVPTNALLQAQALTDADYTAFRVDGRTPAQLREDSIHILWGSDSEGADSGYYWWSLALLNHLQATGWNPKKPI